MWQAVQHANTAAPPKIILDWAKTEADALGEAGGRCRRTLPPEWSADTPEGTDGLYAYSSDSRIKAAKWLNNSLSHHRFTRCICPVG